MDKLIIASLLLILSLSQTQYTTTPLNEGWMMSIVSQSQFKGKNYSTSIPTNVHLDLLQAGDIPDPLAVDNHPKVKWISDQTIKYSLKFKVTKQLLSKKHHELIFEGIDTYSDIKLNNKALISTENAFRKYTVSVSGILQPDNLLQVTINSSSARDNAGQQKQNMPFVYAHTRKACYQYSWDWAPYLVTMGIWKPVHLQSFDTLKLDYVWARTRIITKDYAIVNFAVALHLAQSQIPSNYRLSIINQERELATVSIEQKYSYIDVNMKQPKLWWPNGIGTPNIYDFEIRLINTDNNLVVDARKIPFGIKTTELDLKQKKFTVKINGYPVYCKGANYVPPDMLYARLQNKRYKPANTIENLLNDAVKSNFNMLRVWGGGQYQSDEFLQLASRKGIMLFYDFMFSDSVYPASQQFLVNVEEEIKQQIRRARNYPALMLWSGNNQILQGLNDWGWGKPQYRQNYRKLFEVLIPKIIQYQSPYIPYIPSSPVYGVGNYGLSRGGDIHFWSVWAAGADFESYLTNVGQFNSQFGTQSLPVWQTIVQAIDKAPSYDSATTLLHEKHNSQFNTLKNYMRNYMKQSKNFEMQAYQSGLLQAYAVELAIKGQRIAKPASWGTLYWQLNDAWPAISWSSIDYFGRWKPLQFMARRLYPDVAIFTLNNDITAVSDKLYPVKALAIIQFYSLSGQLLSKIEKQVDFKPNQVKKLHTYTPTDYKNIDKTQVVIFTEIVAGKTEVMNSVTFNARFKDLQLKPTEISVQYSEQFNEITISTKGVVKNLFISHPDKYLKASDNYFDLVPNHPVKVVIEGQKLSEVKAGLRFRSYLDVYSDQSLKVVTV